MPGKKQPNPESDEIKRLKTDGSQSVDRALRLLLLISEASEPLSLQDICGRSGLNRTTAWRLLSCLEDRGFIYRNPHTKNYEIGSAIFQIYSNREHYYTPLIRIALPEMRELLRRFDESVHLNAVFPDGCAAIYQIDPQRSIHLKNYVNQLTPLWGTATGKVALAYFSAKELDIFLRQSLTSFTRDTIIDVDALRKEASLSRERGYAIVEGELSDEENGISAPILLSGKPLAILGIGGPRDRLTRETMENIAPFLCGACRRIEMSLAAVETVHCQ